MPFQVDPVGWESPTLIILRVVSNVPDAAGAEAHPRYVAVRCSVDTGECERLPHPVEVMASIAR